MSRFAWDLRDARILGSKSGSWNTRMRYLPKQVNVLYKSVYELKLNVLANIRFKVYVGCKTRESSLEQNAVLN